MDHPNVIQFKDVYKDRQKNLNIVMEYADGGDLASQIKARIKLQRAYTENEVMLIFTQVCLGMKHCHDRKIMHRDVKPLNIFLTQQGDIKIGDFGISRVLRRTESLATTQAGTLFHMSPEIWKG